MTFSSVNINMRNNFSKATSVQNIFVAFFPISFENWFSDVSATICLKSLKVSCKSEKSFVTNEEFDANGDFLFLVYFCKDFLTVTTNIVPALCHLNPIHNLY